MTEAGNWSNDSRQHTQMIILESKLEAKDVQLAAVKNENLLMKTEILRLQELINTLTKDNISNDNALDRFK